MFGGSFADTHIHLIEFISARFHINLNLNNDSPSEQFESHAVLAKCSVIIYHIVLRIFEQLCT